MTVNTLRKIAAVLNITTDYIVNGTVSAPPSNTLLAMLASMTSDSRKYAEKLLMVYNEAITQLTPVH